MKEHEILLTRVTSSSSKPNYRGFHIMTEYGKYWTGDYHGLLYMSWNKAPVNWLTLKIPEKVFNQMTRNNGYYSKEIKFVKLYIKEQLKKKYE